MTETPGVSKLPEEVLLTPEETAQALGCSTADLHQQRNERQGPAYLDFGDGLIRYPRVDVEHTIAERGQRMSHGDG